MTRNQFLIALVGVAVVILGVAAWFVFFGSGTGSDDAVADTPAYKFTITPYDRTMGSPNAPLTVIEYAAPSCPFCAHFFSDVFPQFKSGWIDTGKAYFVFRVLPINAVDVAAESMARCLPANRYFHFIDLLYRNQDKWDPDGHEIPDVHGALLQMGAMESMNAAKADACIKDQAQGKRTIALAQAASKQYGIDRTPTVFANGHFVNDVDTYDKFNTALTAVAASR